MGIRGAAPFSRPVSPLNSAWDYYTPFRRECKSPATVFLEKPLFRRLVFPGIPLPSGQEPGFPGVGAKS